MRFFWNVTRRADGSLHRYTYCDFADRARRLACALQRLGVAPHRAPFGEQLLEQSNRLEELEPEPLVEEELLYRRICSPALGGHRLRGSLR